MTLMYSFKNLLFCTLLFIVLFSAVSRKFTAVTCSFTKLLSFYRLLAIPDVYMISNEQVKDIPIHQILMRK